MCCLCNCVFHSWSRPELHTTSVVRRSRRQWTKKNKQMKTLRWVQRRSRRSWRPGREQQRRKKRWRQMFTLSTVLLQHRRVGGDQFTAHLDSQVLIHHMPQIQICSIPGKHSRPAPCSDVFSVMGRLTPNTSSALTLPFRHFPCMEMCFCYWAQCLWSPAWE